jgi:hypothetical protein
MDRVAGAVTSCARSPASASTGTDAAGARGSHKRVDGSERSAPDRCPDRVTAAKAVGAVGERFARNRAERNELAQGPTDGRRQRAKEDSGQEGVQDPHGYPRVRRSYRSGMQTLQGRRDLLRGLWRLELARGHDGRGRIARALLGSRGRAGGSCAAGRALAAVRRPDPRHRSTQGGRPGRQRRHARAARPLLLGPGAGRMGEPVGASVRCQGRGSNPYAARAAWDFKSHAFTSFATLAGDLSPVALVSGGESRRNYLNLKEKYVLTGGF